jgi:hypothetical protein
MLFLNMVCLTLVLAFMNKTDIERSVRNFLCHINEFIVILAFIDALYVASPGLGTSLGEGGPLKDMD